MLRYSLLFVVTGIVGLGCIGPAAIQRERLDYSDVIALTGRQQTLVNMVRVDSHEIPQFTDITQVNNSTQVMGSLGATLNLPQQITGLSYTKDSVTRAFPGYTGHDYSPTFSIGGNDQPTVTYTPVLGSALINQIAQPITVDTVVALIDSGWRIRPVLTLLAERLSSCPSQDWDIVDALEDLAQEQLISVVAAKSLATAGTVDDSIVIYFLHDQLDSIACLDKRDRLLDEWRKIKRVYRPGYIDPETIGTYAPPHANNPRRTQDPTAYSIEIRTVPASQPSLLNSDQVIPSLRLRSAFGALQIADQAGWIEFIPEGKFSEMWKPDPSYGDFVQECMPPRKCAASQPAVKQIDETTFFKMGIAARLPSGTIFRPREGQTEYRRHFIAILHGDGPPKVPTYVSVKYHNEYYYIRNDDNISQRNFELASLILTMQAMATTAAPPAPTLNVGAH